MPPTNEAKGNSVTTQIIGGLLIAVCSGSIGYGYSQSTLGIVVHGHEKDIQSLRQNDSNTQTIIEATNHRIDRVADLMGDLVKQNTELVMLLKIQYPDAKKP